MDKSLWLTFLGHPVRVLSSCRFVGGVSFLYWKTFFPNVNNNIIQFYKIM